ncbi:hypothetical protein [Streptomyces sp. CBMA152]|uniref:hypothetical protein n=1 Tax=Streptomyces sp. CBMA152 TaxID=1896312 RepID=UPI0016608128|nr:hypothetical protein [Streptomyces sp. CBMA152]MBD0741926.1 hypothetical protein [Streptomyces sp. CBMA152]
MSYDIFVFRFVNSEQVHLERDVIHEILDAHVTERDPERHFLQLKTGEGGGVADIYLSSESSIMISNFGGDGIMDIISEIMQRLEAVLVLPGGTVVLSREADRQHLPEDFKDWSVVVASTGQEITQAIRAS